MNNQEQITPESGEKSANPENTAPAAVEVIGVSFKPNGKVYTFAAAGHKATQNDHVIVETARGVELGAVAVQNKTIPARDVVTPLRPILRIATKDDLRRHEENKKKENEAFLVCKKKIEEHKLEMNLVEAEYAFDNSKLTFFFTADGRVDFRDLVKDLASVFKTRIELRQIGIRDEAKMLGGLGVCGRPFCCSTFLSDFVQVSIKMAKEQNFSLNSSKISGACGRLMCCLRYEHEAYADAIKHTPPLGSTVKTPSGTGIVVETNPLCGYIKVKFEEKPESPRVFPCEDVTVLYLKNQKPPKTQEDAPKAADDKKASDKK